MVGIVAWQHGRYEPVPMESEAPGAWGEQLGRNIRAALLARRARIAFPLMYDLRAPGPASCSRAQVREITILAKQEKKELNPPRLS